MLTYVKGIKMGAVLSFARHLFGTHVEYLQTCALRMGQKVVDISQMVSVGLTLLQNIKSRSRRALGRVKLASWIFD